MSSVAADPPPLSSRGRFVAGALLALYLVLGFWGAREKSETFDEPMYLTSAYSYVVTGDLSFNREHPPLAKYLMGLPLLLLDLELPADYQVTPGIAYAFYAHQPRASVQDMLFYARVPGVLLGLVLGLYVLRWARVSFGETAGLLALALCMLNPNVLAHCRVAANDFAPTVFIFAACYHVWRWLQTDCRKSLTLGGVMLGLALGSKLTALMLLPVLGLVLLGVAIARRRPGVLGWGTMALLAAGGVLWLLYMGEARTLEHARQHVRFVPRQMSDAAFALQPLESALDAILGSDTPIPLLSFIKGIDHQFDHAAHGHLTYFWGEVSKQGHWAFYIATTLLKNPEGLLALLLLAFAVWRRTARGALHETLLWAFVISQYVLFSRGDVQLGFKYILPVVPFLCVMASRVAADGLRLPRNTARMLGAVLVSAFVTLHVVFDEPGEHDWRQWVPLLVAGAAAVMLWRARADERGDVSPRGVAVLLTVFASVGSLARQPNNLMYFNELAGGPELGAFYSVVGDDWGQDTYLLGEWMAEHDVSHVKYDYYGTGDPARWGVNGSPSYTASGDGAVTGIVAVHVSLLKRLPQAYRWITREEPVARVGNTIWVYDVSDADVVEATAAGLLPD
jgi:4-amino-4-deoxy-L-arabinose transferase-like glycosyltransferase